MPVEVRHNADDARYEIVVDDRLAGIAEYRRSEAAVVFTHTEIVRGLQRRGLGELLVRGALDDVRRNGEKVVAECWYVARFLREHPDYADLTA